MNPSLSVRKPIATLVILIFALTTTWLPAHAALVSTAEVINQNQGNTDLERTDVRAALEAWGVPSEEAQARVDSLTDQEVAEIADQLDQMPAGGSALGTLVGAALLVFFVLLITDILGYTDVFPLTDKAD